MVKAALTRQGDSLPPISICALWHSTAEAEWRHALSRYWEFVKPSNLDLECEFDSLDGRAVEALDANSWYEFLIDKYFRWKYTAANRYATTTKWLRTYVSEGELPALNEIKRQLFSFSKQDARAGLEIARRIRGLGTAGASGLLAVLFPRFFGTVDQFAVESLKQVAGLPERGAVMRMRPASLTVRDGVALIAIMRRKADENNRMFNTQFWTPRRLDMLLWTAGRSRPGDKRGCRRQN